MQEYLPIIIAYFAGAVPFGLLVARIFKGIDIREHGSKNIGATNVLRVCGKKYGIPVLLLDALKGFLPVAAVSIFGCFNTAEDKIPLISALTAFAAVMGHTFPVYLKFKGGKGVATSAGAFLALMPASFGIAFAVFFVCVAITRYISLGSTLAAITIVISHHLIESEPYGKILPITILAWLILLVVIIRHRTNYKRLLEGTENKLGTKKSEEESGEESA
ncbi:MAG: glycerol-3-phosphate 1-O-acyltransferase PlsY [Planctomycetota bacterium]|jgi:glycerol-3-phosphate acyltransferase PlsY